MQTLGEMQDFETLKKGITWYFITGIPFSVVLCVVFPPAIPAIAIIGTALPVVALAQTYGEAQSQLARERINWLEDEQERREIERAKLNISIGGKNNVVNINPTNTATQNNVLLGQEENPAMARIKFFKHTEEFYRQISGGLREPSRSNWLKADGAVDNFQFSDGERITRPEYEDIMRLLEMSGKIVQRRQGTSGAVIDSPTPLLLETVR